MKVWRRVLVAGTVYSWSALVLTLAVCGIFVRSVRSQPPAEAATSVATPPADQTYTGSKACSACHFKQYMAWKKTKHCTDAFAKMPAKYKADPSCLACHATGFGADTGFKDEASTPNLAGTTAASMPRRRNRSPTRSPRPKKIRCCAARSTRCSRRTSACAATRPRATRYIPHTTRNSACEMRQQGFNGQRWALANRRRFKGSENESCVDGVTAGGLAGGGSFLLRVDLVGTAGIGLGRRRKPIRCKRRPEA